MFISAPTTLGSWTDHGEVFSSKKGDNYNAIDANVIQADGKLLFTFGEFQNIFQAGQAGWLTWLIT